MKYLKMLGLFAMAAAALMAFAGVALADEVTSPTGTTYSGTITAEELPAGSHLVLTGSLGIKVECEAHVEGSITSQGPGKAIEGIITSLSFPNCTNNYTATVLKNGTFKAESSQNGTATMFSTDAEVTIHTPLGFNCGYKTTATDVGEIVDSHRTGGEGLLRIVNRAIPRSFHSALCGPTGNWNGSYRVVTPNPIYFDNN